MAKFGVSGVECLASEIILGPAEKYSKVYHCDGMVQSVPPVLHEKILGDNPWFRG